MNNTLTLHDVTTHLNILARSKVEQDVLNGVLHPSTEELDKIGHDCATRFTKTFRSLHDDETGEKQICKDKDRCFRCHRCW